MAPDALVEGRLLNSRPATFSASVAVLPRARAAVVGNSPMGARAVSLSASVRAGSEDRGEDQFARVTTATLTSAFVVPRRPASGFVIGPSAFGSLVNETSTSSPSVGA